MGGVDETLGLHSRFFVLLGRSFAQQVHAAMDVRIIGRVVVRGRFDYRSMLPACSGIVQIDERLAMNRLFQNRKVLANSLNVEGSGLGRFVLGQDLPNCFLFFSLSFWDSTCEGPPESRASSAHSSRTRTASSFILVSTSLANP